MATEVEVVEKVVEAGKTLELRRRQGNYEIRIAGALAWATDITRSEKSLAELTLAPLAARDDVAVLLVGVGIGTTLRALLDLPGVARVDVVESSPTLIDWQARHFSAHNRDALKDKRVHLHALSVETLLHARSEHGAPSDGWLALIIDHDQHTSPSLGNENAIVDLEAALRPGGVLSTWSSARDTALLGRLHARLQNVAEVIVPVDIEGKSALDYVYRARRQPAPTKGAN